MAGTNDERITEGSMGCNVNFGGGRALELDYRQDETPWIALGPGIGGADIWVKGVGGLPDVRIHIERTDDGFQLSIDRGEQSSVWWPSEGPPTVALRFDERARRVKATASVGKDHQFQEVDLGTVTF